MFKLDIKTNRSSELLEGAETPAAGRSGTFKGIINRNLGFGMNVLNLQRYLFAFPVKIYTEKSVYLLQLQYDRIKGFGE